MPSTINYSTLHPSIRTSVPFTWGGGCNWAIKSPAGDIFFLHNGAPVVHNTEQQLLQQPGFAYATVLEIK